MGTVGLNVTPSKNFITAGIPTFLINEPVQNIEEHLVKHPENYRKLNHIYFTDSDKKLVGVMSLQELLELDYSQKVTDKMEIDIKYVFENSPVDRAVALAIHHDITDIPVVDEQKRLVGIISAESLLKLVGQLYSAKTVRHAGLSHEKIYDLVLSGSVFNAVKARIPWLIVGLLGGMLSATFLHMFEGDLQKNIILALFIPSVVYLGGAVNVQSETLFIRTMAIKDRFNFLEYIFKDLSSTTILGTIVGLSLGTIVYFWKGSTEVATILALTMVINFAVASPVAIIIPTLFKKFGKDPALGTGPLATIIQDLTSLGVYFAIAYFILDL